MLVNVALTGDRGGDMESSVMPLRKKKKKKQIQMCIYFLKYYRHIERELLLFQLISRFGGKEAQLLL